MNKGLLLAALLALIALSSGKVWVNEILSASSPPNVDFIELWNDDQLNSADISGWFLSDSNITQKYAFAASTSVPPNGFYVVSQNNFPFGLTGAGGECAVLFNAQRSIIDSVCLDAVPNDVSVGRWVISDGEDKHPLMQWITVGAPNGYPAVGPLVFSEINYYPDPSSDEWLKMTNTGGTTFVFDASDSASGRSSTVSIDKYSFPAGISLAAGASLYLTPIDGPAFRTKYNIAAADQVLGLQFLKNQTTRGVDQLENLGEKIRLFRPYFNVASQRYEDAPMDIVKYNTSAPWYPATAGLGPFLKRRCLKAYGDDPAAWAPSDLNACALLSCGRVDPCTTSTCSGAAASCSCSYDTATAPICAAAAGLQALPTNQTGVALPCIVSAWSEWSVCSKDCGSGSQTSARSVLQAPTSGGAACPTPLSKSQLCNTQACGSPVDCLMETWSSWSPCSCLSSQSATRAVKTPASNGGAACPLDVAKSQSCLAPASCTVFPPSPPATTGNPPSTTSTTTPPGPVKGGVTALVPGLALVALFSLAFPALY